MIDDPVDIQLSLPDLGGDAKEASGRAEAQSLGYELKETTTHGGTTKQYKLVAFGPEDPGDPKNFSKARKWLITMTLGWVCFAVAFSSAVITPGIAAVAEQFDTSEEVALLSITVFVIGFGIGRECSSPALIDPADLPSSSGL